MTPAPHTACAQADRALEDPRVRLVLLEDGDHLSVHFRPGEAMAYLRLDVHAMLQELEDADQDAGPAPAMAAVRALLEKLRASFPEEG